MACKLCSRVCCGQKWMLLLYPVLLLFLTVSVLTVTLPLPRPPFDVAQRLSRSLSCTGHFRSGSREAEPLPAASSRPPPARDRVPGDDEKRAGSGRSSVRGNKQPANRHPKGLSEFPGGKRRWKPGGQEDGRTSGRVQKLRRQPGAMATEQQPLGDLKKPHDPSQDSPVARRNPSSMERRKPLSHPDAGLKGDDGHVCGGMKERAFPEADRRRVRVGRTLGPLPWLSDSDVQKMLLLAGGQVLSKARLPAHGQVLQVALAPNQQGMTAARGEMQPWSSSQLEQEERRAEAHGERCQRGFCSLVKRTDDWVEVFAFHLDRVLGINRSLPAVLRTFRSQVLPYRYISGVPRPVVWWDPDIQHLASRDNDQNSVPLSWVQYQELLRNRCGMDAGLWTAPCVGIHHSEWGRLALFDFLLQVNDRLDRYCCGFSPDPTEPCMENMLHAKCGNTRDLLLVHILVRKADPSRLVFIDNSGRPHQSIDNLNFQLVEGISEFPERAVSVLQSGCLESLLLRSLYTDREFWESQGRASGLRPLIRSVELRGKVLLQHIRDKKLQLNRDL